MLMMRGRMYGKMRRRGAALGPPVNTVAPVISGTPTVGQMLSCTTGTWLNNPTEYHYNWMRNGVAIPLATNNTYTLIQADAEKTMTCLVLAVNAADAVIAASNALGPVASIGGAFLLDGEANGFATDFLYPTDALRVALKASSVLTELSARWVLSKCWDEPKNGLECEWGAGLVAA